MNAIVYNTTHSLFDWISDVWFKFDRTFNRIGYARAAGELRRLGYHEEANHCIKEMNRL